MKITILAEQSKQRLDKFLIDSQLFKSTLNKQLISDEQQFSRQQAQKLIKQGLITVNNKVAKPHYSIKENDLIEINDTWEVLSKAEIKKSFDSAQSAKLSQELLNILAETDEYIVINKPAGLIVHGGTKRATTLADILAEKFPKLIKVGDDPARPGIVHRLDKEVSGLMVIAKTQDSFDNLKEQFKQRKIIKKYTALVYGQISLEDGTISFPIKRASDGFKMIALPVTNKKHPNQEGRSAITEFSILKRLINYTLLKIRIKTGRTHQIRVHMSAYDHPIVGDNIYSTAKSRIQNKKINLNRIFLVADELSFIDLEGNKQSFIIDLPDQLKDLLKKVK